MKILLVGEYSNVHWTLAEGLRALGQDVTVVSDGDRWKNYHRDIDLSRPKGRLGALRYLLKVLRLLPQMRGYDVVQLINPIFFDFKAERMMPFFRYLQRHNRHVFMAAYGMDYYWVKAGTDCKTFRYSDFNIGSQLRADGENAVFIEDWLHGKKGELNKKIADECDGIVAGLYEYYRSYQPYFSHKLTFIPFPINLASVEPKELRQGNKVRFFIGIQKSRSEYKGTDIMLKALERVEKEFPDVCEVVKVESVPFSVYQNLMNTSDVLLDQLYGCTPCMNALLAMAKGLITVGGGEPENYELLNDADLRPIINVEPNEESVYQGLRYLIEHKELIPQLSRQSIEYVKRYHDHVKVAQQYLDFWNGNHD